MKRKKTEVTWLYKSPGRLARETDEQRRAQPKIAKPNRNERKQTERRHVTVESKPARPTKRAEKSPELAIQSPALSKKQREAASTLAPLQALSTLTKRRALACGYR